MLTFFYFSGFVPINGAICKNFSFKLSKICKKIINKKVLMLWERHLGIVLQIYLYISKHAKQQAPGLKNTLVVRLATRLTEPTN